MSSDALQRLRSLSKDQRKLYQSHRNETANIHELYASPYKEYYLAKLIEKSQGQLSQLSQRRQAALADVQRRAAARVAQPTEAGRAKIQHALEHGFTFNDLAQQLVNEGDREGLASLRQYVPYAWKGGHLPGKPDDERALKHAYESLQVYDEQLWDDSERRWNGEAREAAISHPLMEHNEQQLAEFLKQQLNPHAPQQLDKPMYHWQGTPQSPSAKQGSFDPNTYQDLED